MDRDSHEAFTGRLIEAIDQSAPRQVDIAQYVGVTIQSVGGWKKHGRISVDNLKKLSEVTGYRYQWIKDGTGPKLIQDDDQEQLEYHLSQQGSAYVVVSEALAQSPAVSQLLNNLTYAYANRHISEEAIEHLAALVGSLGVTKGGKIEG